MQNFDNAHTERQAKDAAFQESSPHKYAAEKRSKRTSRLIVKNRPIEAIDQENLQALENTAQSIVIHKPKGKTSKTEDYVQLPTIKFKATAHPDEVAVEVAKPQNSLQPSQRSKQGITNLSDLTDLENENSSESEQEPEWAGWNLSKLKIQAESSSSIEHEEMGLPVVELTKRKREQSERVMEKERVRERERQERERNMEMVSNFLSGKATFIWLFILGKNVKDSEMKQVKKVYSDYIENDYEVPICKTYQDAQRFLSLDSCFFKIVADLESSEKLLEESQTNKNIIAIYLYNPRREKGITRTFELKRNSRKIKGMFMNLNDAALQAQEEIENEVKFIRIGHDMERQSNKLRFPSFFILSGVDSSDITAYRLCLYGSLKLTNQREREVYLKEFTDMVEMRYANSHKQLRNLQEYKSIDHTSTNNQEKFRDILTFYVKETFYYGLTNSILRLSRSAEEFRPCTIPFNETFHAIKYFYTKYKREVQCQPFVTYRGAKLRNRDVSSLKIGSFIELLGFTSTSLKRSEAQKFMDNDSYLIQIHVDRRANKPSEEIYDHGFLEINRYGLASEAFNNEQEVLFNALNVFKVVALELDSAVRKITLKYAAILELLNKKMEALNPLEKAVLSNYSYCTSTFQEIEDDGDVLLMAQEHDKCLQYYRNKIEEGEKNGKIYGKLAHCQVETGDLDGAYDSAIKSLSMFKQQFRSQSLEITAKHSKSLLKNAQIFDIKEDIINYDDSIEVCLKINQENWFLKAKILKERANKKLQIGDFQGAKVDIQLSKQIIKEKQVSFDEQRRSLKRQFFFKSLCCLCNRSSSSELQEEKQLQLMKIQQQQIEFLSKKDETTQLCLELENISKRLYEETGNTEKLRQCRKSAQQLFKQLKKDYISLNPLFEAKYHVLEASVVDQEHKFHQYEDLMELAIQLVQQEDPFHENVGIYNKMLARKRHQIIHKKFMLPNQQEENPKKDREKRNSRFDLEEHKRLYQQSKLGYLAANDNMVYNKGGSHPEVLQVSNQMAELDYDYSLLKQAETTTTNIASHHISNFHSQGAKCYLLLAKIALARGEVKRAYKQIEQANKILKKALVKADTVEYNDLFHNNPLYTDIHLHLVKIFNRQLKHDLALKELQIIKKIAKKKINTQHNKNLFASIYEEQAEVMICLGETLDFEKYILKAIEIREKQMGKYNIPNAICYSNLFKYLRYINDFDQALKYHYRATQIFSRFPPDHPNAWIIHLSNGLTFHRRKQYDLAINQIHYCLKIAQKRYSSNHINLLKIEFQYGKLLHSMGYVDKAQKILEELSRILEENIKQSATLEKMERETDDEKLSIKKNLYIELKEIYSKNRSQKDLMRTILGIQRCQSNLRECEEFIQTDEKIDSLKSLN